VKFQYSRVVIDSNFTLCEYWLQDNKENLMNLISKYRKQGGLSQQALASKVGWGQSRLANYEVNTRTPSLDDSRRIVSALNDLGVGCTLDEVFPPKITKG